MSSDDKLFGWVCSLAAIVLCVLIISVVSCNSKQLQLRVENGYEEVQKEGTTYTMWQKAD